MADTSPRWSRATVVLGTLTAFFGLLATVAGVFGVSSSQAESDVSGQLDAAQRKAAADRRTIESLRTTNNDLQGQMDGLETELDTLRKQLPSSAPSQAQTPGASVVPPGGSVYHHGVVSLPAGGTSIDFEAPPEDDRWTSDVSRNRISIHPVGALEMNLRVFVLPAGDRASLDYCSQSTLYVPYDSNDSNKITTGTVFCAQSDAGRFGAIRIVSKSRDLWTFEVTTWQI